MFNSKSKLTAEQLADIRLTAIGLSEWVRSTACTVMQQHTIADLKLPICMLGSGSYGAAYALLSYPGLVVKVCRWDSDGYPAWIRECAKHQGKRYIPRVFDYGHHERDGSFWCIIPELESASPCDTYEGKAAEHNTNEFLGVVRVACSPARETLQRWIGPGQGTRPVSINRDKHLTKKERRIARSLRSLILPMVREGACPDLHSGNVMLDHTKTFVVTDPLCSFYMADKDRYEAKRAHG